MTDPVPGGGIPDDAIYSPGYGNRARYTDAAGNVLVQECSKCKRLLPVDAFSRNAALHRGVDSQCKTCAAKRNRDHYRRDPMRPLMREIIARSSRKGIFCDLTADDIRAVYDEQGGRCFYTGEEFGTVGENTVMSVDRIEPGRGYTRNNIVLCLRWVNVMKLDHSVGEFLAKILLVARNSDAIRAHAKIAPYLKEDNIPR